MFKKNNQISRSLKLSASAVAAALIFGGCALFSGGEQKTDSAESSRQKIDAVDGLLALSGKAAHTMEIIHVNDIHSYIDPLGVSFKTPKGMLRVKVGGPEALNSIITERRKHNPDLLVISAGDQITGNASNYDLFHGEADAALYNLFKIDFYMLGNHEFDHGGKGIAVFMDYMKKYSPNTVFLNSDLTVGPDNAMKDTGVKEYFKTVGGEKVAFYGVTAVKKVPVSSSPDPDMKFAPTIETINKMTAKNKDKAKIQILVSHQGLGEDLGNSAMFNDIDVIVGGDSHSLLGNFSKYGLKGEGVYPIIKTNASGHKICIVQANEYGKVLGDLVVSFDKDGNVVDCAGSPFMPLWKNTAEFMSVDDKKDNTKAAAVKEVEAMITDKTTSFVEAEPNAAATAAMKPFRDKIKKKFKHLGKVKQNLCSTIYPTDECVIKNEISPYGSETCSVYGKMYIADTDAQIFLGNSGMFRVDIENGDFSDADLLAVTPFSSRLLEMNMTGSEITRLLNEVMVFVNAEPYGRDGGVPCGYGFKYALKSSGKTPVTDIKIGEDYPENINPKKTYKVIVPDYIAKGKDGYTFLKTKKAVKDYGLDADKIRKYLKKYGAFPVIGDLKTITSYKP